MVDSYFSFFPLTPSTHRHCFTALNQSAAEMLLPRYLFFSTSRRFCGERADLSAIGGGGEKYGLPGSASRGLVRGTNLKNSKLMINANPNITARTVLLEIFGGSGALIGGILSAKDSKSKGR